MIAPPIPSFEKQRLNTLESYTILDTLEEEDYDRITALTAQICDTPVSLITLIDKDRQWFKSHHGIAMNGGPREYALCAHAINSTDECVVIENTRMDERFIGNPLVEMEPGAVFYAGVLLRAPNGMPLGTLCAIDHKTRSLSNSQKESLKTLSHHVMALLELRRHKKIQEEQNDLLKEQNEALKAFAHVAAHDMKSPLSRMILTCQLLKEDHGTELSEQARDYILRLEEASWQMSNLISGILDYHSSANPRQSKKSKINLRSIISETMSLVDMDENGELKLNLSITEITSHQTALSQIFLNLLSNALKYNDKSAYLIEVGAKESENEYVFYVTDNGQGIKGDPNKMLNLFERSENADKYGVNGNGIGLATVKRLINSFKGDIHIESTPKKGTTVHFSIPK